MLSVSLLAGVSSFAQSIEYSEDFESYALHADPAGWIDTSVGQPGPEAKGLYKTWPDPLAPDNVVFGTRQASGSPDGNTPRIGTFATYADKEFASQGRFEFRGRLLRTSAASRLGLSFFSSYPEEDRYYLVGLWVGDGGALTMRLFASGGEPAGALDSGFTPEPGQWIRFLVQADEVGEATHIRARFWPDGSAEPDVFQIAATDVSTSRPVAGRIGIWAAVRGDVYADDLHARSPVDHVPPVISFLESGEPMADGSVFPRDVTPEIRVTDDLSPFTYSATLDGMPWTSGTISTDGPHALAVTATDAAGNVSEAAVTFSIDQSPPALALLAPPPGSCTSAATIALSGTYADPYLASITILTGGAPIPAAVDPEQGTWSAALAPSEGPLAGAIEAIDAFGHRAIHPFAILIDRTAPLIDVAIGGAPAADGIVASHPLALSAAVRDRDPAVALDLRLDGVAWASPAIVSAEGAHELIATAADCAGNEAQRRIAFTIDLTPPAFGAFTPPQGATVGEMPDSIAGTVSADAIRVTVAGSALSAEPADGSFTLAGLPFAEGLNRFLIRAADAAGNAAETEYRVTVSTRAPSIEIVESGAPLPNGALFNREVRPEIRISDPDATRTVTLDGAPFVSGTAISAEGTHALRATTTDAVGHTTTVEVSFTIDRTPPAIAITAPQPGAVSGERVEVAGTAGDAASVTVNGVPAALAAGAFTATVPLEEGENLLIATGRDAAGNSGRAEVLVSRDTLASGIVLTSPADGTMTNRPSVRVTGRVLSPLLVQLVTIGSTAVAFDPAGNFVLESFPLAEGTNAIVATAVSTDGRSRSVAVNVVADRTPPVLRILQSGAPMDDEARFASAAALSLEASDERALASTEARIDGAATAMPAAVTASGGHSILAVAMDAAGNETRVERTFFIGGAGAGGCRLEAFVPATGTVIGSTVTGLTARTGGAAGVKVNGIPASVADGSFCATVELPVEGPNEITIVCTDAEGNAVGNPETVTLTRATQLPSVTIEAPAEGVATATELVTVNGTAGPGVVEVTVNGRSATIADGDPNAPRAYTVADLRLVPGLNVLLAKGRTASMKQAAASRRILYLKDAPSVAITVPLSGATIGNHFVSISGTYRNLDPSTLAVAGSAASAEMRPLGGAEGSFLFRNVALQPGANALAVSGSDALSRIGSASVDVTRDDAAPFIAIVDPADHAYFGLAAGPAFTVTGTAIAAPGATIDVAGAPATIVATDVLSPTRRSYSFSATVSFATLGATPIVARVTEPSGASATQAIRVTKLAAAPQVSQTFPENLAVAVDPGAMMVVVFTNPMDRATLASAFRLETASGSPVAGTTRFDRDAITFAPSAPLGAGEYRIRVAATAADAGDEPLGTEYVSTFQAATDAPTTAPVLDPLPARVCDSTVTISGTATPGARVRVELGTLSLNTTAGAAGHFTIALPLSGPAGYQLVQARAIGANGTLSPAAQACLLAGCGGLEVVSATFDRTVNSLTIRTSADVDPATATAEAIRLRATDGTLITMSISVLGSAVTVTPAEDLTQRSFNLEVTTGIRATDGTALRAPYKQNFPFSGDQPPPADGTGFISGEVLDAGTGRPLAGAAVSVVVPSLPAANAQPLTPGPSPRSATQLQTESPTGRGEPRSDANPAGTGGSSRVSAETGAEASPPLPGENGVQATAEFRGEGLGVRGLLRATEPAPIDLATTRPPLPDENRVQATAEFRGEGLGVRGLHRASEASLTILTDHRGRYAVRLPEGAHTVHVIAENYTEVWRQIVVPAGQGVTPIDIRLTKRSDEVEIDGAVTLTHGGDTAVTTSARLDIPAGGIAAGTHLTFTSIGAQSLAGLLPLGWSPIASVEVERREAGDEGRGEAVPLTATLSFAVDPATIAEAAQTLTLVRYEPDRDEWRVITPAVNIEASLASSPITTTGSYALVYSDPLAPRPSSLAPLLTGIDDPCAAEQPCTIAATAFTLDPEIVLPTETSIATLTIDGTPPFPSGTAVQAWIDEELRLSDGSVLLDPPFAADLILYRSLDGNHANAVFAIAPTPRAAEVILEVGYDRINVLPYPGRLARGTLVGSEGGRIPGDGSVVVEIPAGATVEPLRASSQSLTTEELSAFAPAAGFRTLGGFSLELQRASDAPLLDIDGDGIPDAAEPELTASARVTFHADPANVPAGAEVIVAEVLNNTPYDRVIRLAARATEVVQGGTEAKLFTTRPIDRAVLPLDGVVREGTYLFLAAEQPIAFATGAVRRGAAAPYLASALVTAPPLGVQDLTRITGLFAIPVLAEPATPFTLTARHTTTGEGSPYQAAAAPVANTIVAIGDFILVPQPPRIVATTPSANAVSVPLNTTVRVQFDRALDPSSIAPDAIVVAESNTGTRIEGTTALDGQSAILWTQPPAPRPLTPSSRYDVTVNSRVTATTGAPLGAPYSFSFTTIDTLTSSEVHPERISITIPQNGISTIRGTAGALPTGWQAVAVRRNTDFAVRYQTTAATDGSFSFQAGTCTTTGAGGTVSGYSKTKATSGPPLPGEDRVQAKTEFRGEGSGVRGTHAFTRLAQVSGAGGGVSPTATSCPDAIQITDLIDLQILNTNGTLTAILSLTPFVGEDGTSFLVSPHTTSTFTTSENITITVPAGAFDQPTLVTATAETKDPLAEVPDLDTEVNWSASVELTLDCTAGGAPQSSPCIAKKRVDLEIPAPNADPARSHILTLLGQSIRGPRLMAVDTLRIENGKFTTAAETVQGAAQTARPASLAPRPSSLAPLSTLLGPEVKSHLLGVNRSGIFSVVDANVPTGSSFGWGVIEGLQAGFDLFWDLLDSFYAAHFYMTEAKGTIAIPILTGVPFKLTGVDAATGLDAFETVYDPIPVLDPGAGFLVDSPLDEKQGPYPVFATPFRIELVEVGREGIDLEHVPNFTIRLDGGLVSAADSAEPLTADVPVALFNPSNGALDTTRSDGLVVPGSAGDRIVLVAGAREVDPNAPLSIVFSQPLDLGGAGSDDEIDALLRTRFTVHKIVGTSPAEDVTALYRFRADSGGRRVLIDGAASLHRGASVRILVSKDLAGASGLKIGEFDDGGGTKGGLAGDLALELTTRAPAGTLGSFEIAAGSIRDLARSGNMMFVAALDGGLRAYDLADSASPKPLAVADSAIDDYWAVAVDAHDRVFATALGGTFGVLRTFRAEDFRQSALPPQPLASGLVSWAPGYSGMLSLASATVLSDRPEAIPRRLQVLAQDVEVGPMVRDAFKEEAGVAVEKTADLAGGFEELSVTVPWDAQLGYAVQRVTVENLDGALRWSGDAKPQSPAVIEGIVARAGDRLVLIRNQRTYAVVSLFGYGVGLFDVNAMESNDASDKPEGYASLRERVLVTSAKLEPATCGHPEKESGAIPDLAFSPEAAILAHDAEAWIRLYALDAGRGVLDLKITPSSAGAPGTPFCGRGPMGMLFRSKAAAPPDDPRLHAMRAKFEALAARPPFGRFNVIATHRWRIAAHDNAPLVPGGKIGSRGTVANTAAERDYLLIAGNEYGLLITEAPNAGFLGAHHLADVVWIPAGAVAVRKVAGSDLAVVVDGEGHLLLVDLARIDERWDASGVPIPEGAIFPTLDASLGANGAYGTGLADPRIVWRSDEPVASGTLAPLVDPDTGNVITARLLEKTVNSVAAVDPRVRAMIDPDGGGTLRETTGVVPLGIRP